MNFRVHSMAVGAVLALVGGCASPSVSPREAFLATVPNERTNYVQLYEVSVESLREREDKLLSVTTAIVSGVRESSKVQTNSAAVEERLQRIDMVAESLHKSMLKKLAELERMYDPRTDCILFFRYDSVAQEESGFLLTSGGKVKKRLVLGEDWMGASPTPIKPAASIGKSIFLRKAESLPFSGPRGGNSGLVFRWAARTGESS